MYTIPSVVVGVSTSTYRRSWNEGKNFLSNASKATIIQHKSKPQAIYQQAPSVVSFFNMATKEQLLAITPIDGRYADKVTDLQSITSEYGLIKRRVAVSAGWLSVMGSGVLPDRAPLGDNAHRRLTAIAEDLSIEDALEIKLIEDKIRHDVNAVVRWLKGKVSGDPAFENYDELVHFGRTSEDVNNLAYAMMIRDTRDEVLIPGIDRIEADLHGKSGRWAEIPMLAHTHGQAAVPTTMGKEMAVFAERLKTSTRVLGDVAIYGKLNGASGNYNADTFAYPEVNWEAVSEHFVRSLGFQHNTTTTQIEPHDWIVRFSNELGISNSIMRDLSQDMWLYIMKKYLAQEVDPDQDGSSAMPQKVNPIDFENAEANLAKANSDLRFLADKLPVSRLQRDLSDSSALRTVGEAFGHTVVGHKSIMRGLKKVHPNELALSSDLDQAWAVLAEPVQTIARKHGILGAYDAVKEATRGKELDQEGYVELVSNLEGIPQEDRQRLLELTPATYLGKAVKLARE